MRVDAEHTHFYLVRHGESIANVQGYVGGSTDDPLTDKGHSQAQKVAAHLKDAAEQASAIYASPLQRAWNTAGYIGEAMGKTPEAIDTLVEWHAGDWEKLEYHEVPQQEGFSPGAIIDPLWAPPNGEALGEVQSRVVTTLEDLQVRHAGEHVVVVSHGTALALSLAHFVDQQMGAWIQYKLENCSVTELVLGPESRLIVANHTEHLLR